MIRDHLAFGLTSSTALGPNLEGALGWCFPAFAIPLMERRFAFTAETKVSTQNLPLISALEPPVPSQLYSLVFVSLPLVSLISQFH